jgi:hypothetical protein
MSMSSRSSFADDICESNELATTQMQARVFSLNFPTTVFTYRPAALTQEEKQHLLINKNREVLEHQMRLLENYAVDVTEDSLCSEMLPHANPPLSLSFVESGLDTPHSN